jgi:hypothetical protein
MFRRNSFLGPFENSLDLMRTCLAHPTTFGTRCYEEGLVPERELIQQLKKPKPKSNLKRALVDSIDSQTCYEKINLRRHVAVYNYSHKSFVARFCEAHFSQTLELNYDVTSFAGLMTIVLAIYCFFDVVNLPKTKKLPTPKFPVAYYRALRFGRRRTKIQHLRASRRFKERLKKRNWRKGVLLMRH